MKKSTIAKLPTDQRDGFVHPFAGVLEAESRPNGRVTSVPVCRPNGRWTIAATGSWELAVAFAKAVLAMPKAAT